MSRIRSRALATAVAIAMVGTSLGGGVTDDAYAKRAPAGFKAKAGKRTDSGGARRDVRAAGRKVG